VDQLTAIFKDTENQMEKSLDLFAHTESHTSQHLAKIVLDMIDMLGSDIMNCRSQSFDSAASISGEYCSLQARLKNENPP
jgi:chemotaxis protein histidine kinase CheA